MYKKVVKFIKKFYISEQKNAEDFFCGEYRIWTDNLFDVNEALCLIELTPLVLA